MEDTGPTEPVEPPTRPIEPPDDPPTERIEPAQPDADTGRIEPPRPPRVQRARRVLGILNARFNAVVSFTGGWLRAGGELIRLRREMRAMRGQRRRDQFDLGE